MTLWLSRTRRPGAEATAGEAAAAAVALNSTAPTDQSAWSGRPDRLSRQSDKNDRSNGSGQSDNALTDCENKLPRRSDQFDPTHLRLTKPELNSEAAMRRVPTPAAAKAGGGEGGVAAVAVVATKAVRGV
jgi:hypothetical protein